MCVRLDRMARTLCVYMYEYVFYVGRIVWHHGTCAPADGNMDFLSVVYKPYVCRGEKGVLGCSPSPPLGVRVALIAAILTNHLFPL